MGEDPGETDLARDHSGKPGPDDEALMRASARRARFGAVGIRPAPDRRGSQPSRGRGPGDAVPGLAPAGCPRAAGRLRQGLAVHRRAQHRGRRLAGRSASADHLDGEAAGAAGAGRHRHRTAVDHGHRGDASLEPRPSGGPAGVLLPRLHGRAGRPSGWASRSAPSNPVCTTRCMRCGWCWKRWGSSRERALPKRCRLRAGGTVTGGPAGLRGSPADLRRLPVRRSPVGRDARTDVADCDRHRRLDAAGAGIVAAHPDRPGPALPPAPQTGHRRGVGRVVRGDGRAASARCCSVTPSAPDPVRKRQQWTCRPSR